VGSSHAHIKKIEYDKENQEYLVSVVFAHAEDQKAVLAFDRILCCAGFRFDSSIFAENCRPKLEFRDKFPAMTSEWESTNIKDLYFAGTLMQVRDHHKTHSNVIHGFRSNIKALSQILEHKYHQKPLPCHCLPLTPEAVAAKIIDRVSTSQALFLQQGFLGDLVIISQADQKALYYESLPVDYIHDSDLGKNEHYYLITMEFGKITGDPFSIDRTKDQDKAYLDVYLHPIIRRFNGSCFASEYHIAEHLENDWRGDRSVKDQSVIRSIEYTNQPDAGLFQSSYIQQLKEFLAKDIQLKPEITSEEYINLEFSN
jgi:hypothetical protein